MHFKTEKHRKIRVKWQRGFTVPGSLLRAGVGQAAGAPELGAQ